MHPLCDSSHWHQQKPRSTSPSTGPTRYLHPITPDCPTMYLCTYHEISDITRRKSFWCKITTFFVGDLSDSAATSFDLSSLARPHCRKAAPNFFKNLVWSLLQCKNVEFLGGMIGELLELLGLRQCARQKSVFRKSREKLWMKQTDCRHRFGDSGRLSLQICMISPDPTNVYQRYDMFSSFDTNEKDSNGTKDCNMPTIPWTMLSKTQKHQNSYCLKRDASTTYSVLIILLYYCTLVPHAPMLHHHIAQQLWSHGIVHLHF